MLLNDIYAYTSIYLHLNTNYQYLRSLSFIINI